MAKDPVPEPLAEDALVAVEGGGQSVRPIVQRDPDGFIGETEKNARKRPTATGLSHDPVFEEWARKS